MSKIDYLEALKRAISADDTSSYPDGREPIDDLISDISASKATSSVKQAVASPGFVALATQSVDYAISCRHFALALGLQSAVDADALRSAYAKKPSVGVRVQLLFMLRDCNAPISFMALQDDAEIRRSAASAWIDLAAELVSPEELVEQIVKGVNAAEVRASEVILNFPKIRRQSGTQFVRSMMTLVKSKIPRTVAGELAHALDRTYGLGAAASLNAPDPAGAEPTAADMKSIAWLSSVKREREERRQRISAGGA